MTDRRRLKPVEWIASALDDLLKGELGSLIEIVEDFDGDTYRAVYTVKLRGAVYVLHVFQKKSTRGIATPRREIALTKERYARARDHHAAHYRPQEEQ